MDDKENIPGTHAVPTTVAGQARPTTSRPSARQVQTALSSLRQLRYRKPFRIPRAKWPDYWTEIMARAQGAFADDAGTAPKTDQDDPSRNGNDVYPLLTDVITSLWRARRRMLPDEGKEPPDALRPSYRHISAAWDALASDRVEIKDHTGERYVPGMALQVIAFQPTPGLTHETVLETIKPSVFHADTLIQRGEVIVGTPSSPADAGTDSAASPQIDDGSETTGSGAKQ